MSAAVIVAYALAWMASSVYLTRWIADNKGRCTGHSVDDRSRLMDDHTSSVRHRCLEWHGVGCWRADGKITPERLLAAAAFSLAWPLAMALAVVWSAANRKPTSIGLQREIERLEREAGIR